MAGAPDHRTNFPRPIDLYWIEKACSRGDVPPRWNPAGRSPSPEWIARRLWAHVYSQTLIGDGTAPQVGSVNSLVQVHDVDLRHRHGWCTVLARQAASVPSEPVGSFIDHVFKAVDIDVIVLQYSMRQRDALQDLLAYLFEDVGVLRNYEMVNGVRVDCGFAVAIRPATVA